MRLKCLQAGLTMVVLFTACSALHSQEASIAGVAEDLARSLAAGTHKRVAVVDFTDLNSTVTLLGRHFAQELEIDLATSQMKLDLVNRSRLSELIKELKLNVTGTIDPATAKQLGKFAGVDVLIVGTVTPLDEVVRLDVEAINTEDARVLAAASRNILKTRDILALLGQAPREPESANPIGTLPQQSSWTQPAPKTPQVFKSRDIEFALKTCVREAASIACKLIITNKGDDRNIGIIGSCNNPPSRFIDGDGREFDAHSEIIGSRKNEGCGHVEGTLVSGVSTQAEVRFENIPSSVSSISLLELPSFVVGGDGIDVKFHAVPLLR